MATTKLFTYKIRNPRAQTDPTASHWINLGTCYQDEEGEENTSSPYFIFEGGITQTINNSVQEIETSIKHINGDSNTYKYYNLNV